MDETSVDIAACRGRQQRLIHEMQQLEVDVAIVTLPEHVQWLAGPRFAWIFQAAAALTVDGHLTLVSPQQHPESAAADESLVYEAKWHSTLRNDQRSTCMEVLENAVHKQCAGRTVGVEYSAFGRHWRTKCQHVDLEPTLYRLRRKKDSDELQRIRRAIAATGSMYERARAIIQPGISELEVFNALQAAAVETCGEMLTGTGNDYQCGSRGGPPRHQRLAAAGELYILDLGPAFRGYFADNARTIAVSEPTDEQQEAWTHVVGVLDYVQKTVRPGLSARQLFQDAERMLGQAPCGVFNHHLGHGIGLFPHETPHLNPHWDDAFEVGDVFTAEPGLYDTQLAAGLRIENDYLVTADGVELLSDFPLEL